MAGRPPKYLNETFDLSDEAGYTPAQVADVSGAEGEARRLMVQAFNGRAARIRDRWRKVKPIGGQPGCYPGLLWKAILPRSAFRSQSHFEMLQERANAWVDAYATSEVSEQPLKESEPLDVFARPAKRQAPTFKDEPKSVTAAVRQIEPSNDSKPPKVRRLIPKFSLKFGARAVVPLLIGLICVALFVSYPILSKTTPIEKVDRLISDGDVAGLRVLLGRDSYVPLRSYIIQAIAKVQQSSEVPYYQRDGGGFIKGMQAIFAIEPAMLVMEDRILEVGDWITVDGVHGYITSIESSKVVLETSMGHEILEIPPLVVFDYYFPEPYPITLFSSSSNGNAIVSAIAMRLGLDDVGTLIDANMFGYSKSKSYGAFFEEVSPYLGVKIEDDALVSDPQGLPGYIGFADFAGIRPTSLSAMFESYGRILGWSIDYQASRNDDVSYAPRQFDEASGDVGVQVHLDYATRTATLL